MNRVKTKIKLKINGKTSVYSSFTKRKILGLATTVFKREVTIYESSVIVDYGHGYTNEFDFDDINDYQNKLKPCLEDELLQFLGAKI